MKKYALLIMLLFSEIQTNAYDNPGLPGDDPDVPLDGGTTMLFLAGAAFGARKIRTLNHKGRL